MCRFLKGSLFFIGLIIFLTSCSSLIDQDADKDPEENPPFAAGAVQGELENNEITEASGLAGGGLNEGTLWVHNDSGNEARLFLMTEKGQQLAEYFLENKTNVDWESMASGPGPVEGINYLYVADIGGNAVSREVVKIFRFPEPEVLLHNTPLVDTVQESEIDVLLFTYPNGENDAECLLLDPLTKNLFIVTKGEGSERLFKAAYPQEINKEMPLEEVGRLPLSGITGGDISADGMEVLLKTYTRILYWKRETKEPLHELLQTPHLSLPYLPEPQGECIAWKKDGTGFFTTSEEIGHISARLLFYERN